MKKVLITGKNSYIGNSVEKWLMKEPENFHVDKISMRDESWKEKDFSQYDVVLHVAGLAHIKENNINQTLYYKVNRDLAYDTAKKANEEGVEYFIFLSSMSVYGVEEGTITYDTPLKPKNAYGKSKIEAENLIKKLTNDLFTIAIIRPPMVYGKGCKGNYPKLSKLAVKMPFFPKYDNNRSMIYIDNLSEFMKQLIDYKKGGLFFPQNFEYIKTSELVSLISESNGDGIILTTIFNPLIKIINTKLKKKIFGTLVYDMNLSKTKFKYNVYNFSESIRKTEEGCSVHK